jgi:23S rRNA (adenine2503-C2)-methyltransferase
VLGFKTGRSAVHHSVSSPCGTRKLLLQLSEGRLIEAVGIPLDKGSSGSRLTVCVSSQVRAAGCSAGAQAGGRRGGGR